ncbi:MAG: hypothetical protein IJE77_12480 [Thermoguttaceae bacterium]|nr:hypothetical protein [Thermoguttaceae bacterium]
MKNLNELTAPEFARRLFPRFDFAPFDSVLRGFETALTQRGEFAYGIAGIPRQVVDALRAFAAIASNVDAILEVGVEVNSWIFGDCDVETKNAVLSRSYRAQERGDLVWVRCSSGSEIPRSITDESTFWRPRIIVENARNGRKRATFVLPQPSDAEIQERRRRREILRGKMNLTR